MTIITNELYPENYLLLEDEEDMGEGTAQSQLVFDLVSKLKWHYQVAMWLIAPNIELYSKLIASERRKITPDVAVFKDIVSTKEGRVQLASWNVDKTGQCPPVVFEISSPGTWEEDIREGAHGKPAIYGRIGVKEYFACDPNFPAVWKERGGVRLLGWRYGADKVAVPIIPDAQGRLWSEELESWLVADGEDLRLYDREGKEWLTGTEAGELERVAKEVAQKELKREKARRKKSQKEAVESKRLAEREATARLEAQRQAEQQAQLEIAARLQAERKAQLEVTARLEAERQAEQLLAAETTARLEAEREAAELRRQLEELRKKQG